MQILLKSKGQSGYSNNIFSGEFSSLVIVMGIGLITAFTI
jgi:hypothetical protein